jgi:hypothetical protein
MAALAWMAADVAQGGSRAGVLALVTMAVLVAWWRPAGFRWAAWGVCMALVAAPLAMPSGIVHRVGEELRGGEPGAFARTRIWGVALSMVRAAPLGGVGPGAFGEAFPAYRPAAFAVFSGDYAHSEPLQAAAELGVIGFGLAAWGFACWWKLARRAAMRDPDRCAAGAALAAVGVFAAVDFPLHVPVLALVATGLAAALAGPGVFSRRPSVPRWPVLATGLLVALWLASGAAADLAYRDGLGRQLEGDQDGARRRFDLALAADPAQAMALEALAELDPAGPLTPGRLAAVRRLRPAWVPPLSTAFDRAVMRDDMDEARRIREAARAVDPWGLGGDLMDVTLEMKAGSFAVAARRIADIQARWPGSFDAALLGVDVDIARGRRDVARGRLRAMEARFPGSFAIRARLARLGS